MTRNTCSTEISARQQDVTEAGLAMSTEMRALRVAVILPCFNEEQAIGAVVNAFRQALPDALIYVFDNESKDETARVAGAAGAIVRRVKGKGKGNVIRQAFAGVIADVYVVADGDGTYDASYAPKLIETLLNDGLDMVVGSRNHGNEKNAYRTGHIAGNRILNSLVKILFSGNFVDMLSGYRAFSRPFIKSFPALATGFEIETEMTLHAIQLGLPMGDVPTPYAARQEGSKSKLRTFGDGAKILWFIVRLLKHTRPLLFFSIVSGFAAITSLLIGIPVVIEFLQTSLVPRFPTAFAAASLMVISFLALTTGLILDGIAHAQKENKRLMYLAVDRSMPS